MRDVLDALDRWRGDGRPAAVARLVEVVGSSPREIGAAMAVAADGEVAGSVSGGCVEGAVVSVGMDLLEREGPPELHTFGIADEEAFAVGLTCGGTIRVLVQRLDDFDVYDVLRQEIAADRACVLGTVVKGANPGARMLLLADGTAAGTTGDPALDAQIAQDAAEALGRPDKRTVHLRYAEQGGEARVVLELFAPSPRLILFGAVDFAGALVRLGKQLGYHVTVCDARSVFATQLRFPLADEVVVEWPDSFLDRVGPSLTARDVLCVLTHDAKFDVPAVIGALATKVGYIGALGSRRTTEDRTRRLLEAGASEEQLVRVLAPVGLDIGARTPEETAVAIFAEVIMRQTGASEPLPLREGTGPIHRSAAHAR
jgi:xanthine dehydrogenase accessory factor